MLLHLQLDSIIMKIKTYIFIILGLFAFNAVFAQAPVPPMATADTLETLEQSLDYKSHQTQTAQIQKEEQAKLDSLFSNHNQIVNTLRIEAAKDWEWQKAENEKTLKALRTEEVELKKELEREKKKNNGWLQKQMKKSLKKTKTSTEEEDEE